MSVEVLQYIELAAYIVAGLFLLAAIILFFVLKIPAVVGDLTGTTAKRAIESIRQQNENAVNAEKSKKSVSQPTYNIMNKTSATSRLKKKSGAAPGQTEKMATDQLVENAMAAAEAANETTVLTQEQLPNGDPNATTVLSPSQLPGGDPNATTVLSQSQLPGGDLNATTVLSPSQLPGGDPNATTVLKPDQMPGVTPVVTDEVGHTAELTPASIPTVQFSIDIEMGFAESKETID